jgi:Na+/proline symporter
MELKIMKFVRSTLAGVAVVSVLAAGAASAADSRSFASVPSATSKKLHRVSLPAVAKSKDVDTTGLLIGAAGIGALGTGIYFLAKDDNPTTTGS